MAKEYKFEFDIEPVQQQRPRFARRGRFVRTYDPAKTANFKKVLHQLAIEQFSEEPLTGAIKVEIKFFRAIQKSISKKEHVKRVKNEHRPSVKPDLDNYIKSCLDALTGVFWVDDNEIVDLITGKYYSEHPHIEIKITQLEEVK